MHWDNPSVVAAVVTAAVAFWLPSSAFFYEYIHIYIYMHSLRFLRILISPHQSLLGLRT